MKTFYATLFAISTAISGIAQENLNKLDSLITSGHFKEMSSVVIAHKGKIIFENYYNDATAATLHNTRSATKSITGTLIGALINDGKLSSTQEPAWKYTQVKNLQNPDPRKEKITIESLLTMSSILECDDWNDISRGQEEKMYLLEDWVKFYWDLPVKGYPEWETKPEDSPYGRDFSYCTAGTVALGDVINTISGSLETYAETALFSKLGITDYHWQLTPTGIPMTGGGLGIKSKDLIKIGQLYLNNGNWKGEQIISSAFAKASKEPKAVMGSPDYEYGYLWWIGEFGKDKKETGYFMLGNGGNKIAVFDDLELVVVLTSSLFTKGIEAHNQTAELLNTFIIPEIQKIN
ncbi:serine hydrolase [uncultured Dokdonia sp.]|uniref:serine hydrolase domain-containing protein n=1 Tax=uncultured Dokdonia sp. TaxID=575653 RepID=UPI0030EDF28D|tara:strand:- start:36076 stop:37122 length:1047 start_codon:yes stop_codon:yes gene_type:complete